MKIDHTFGRATCCMDAAKKTSNKDKEGRSLPMSQPIA